MESALAGSSGTACVKRLIRRCVSVLCVVCVKVSDHEGHICWVRLEIEKNDAELYVENHIHKI